jgi:hypothetical protein
MKYYNVLVLILFILIMAVCTSSCTPIKTKHYITIDHNINIKIDVNKPINITHNHHYDNNGTKEGRSTHHINR